jgi:hypothetical protein
MPTLSSQVMVRLCLQRYRCKRMTWTWLWPHSGIWKRVRRMVGMMFGLKEGMAMLLLTLTWTPLTLEGKGVKGPGMNQRSTTSLMSS